MAKRRVVYRSKRARRRGRKSGIMGMKLFDVSQGMYNVYKLGYVDAAKLAMAGNYEGAATQIIGVASDPKNTLTMAVGNLWLGLNRKVLRATGGRFVRRWIA